MNGISIPINIDTSRITAAIAEIHKLHSAMGSIPGMDESLQMQTAIEQMQRVQGNQSTSGLPKEMAGIDAATRRIASNFDRWQSAAAKARAELKRITEDIVGLNKASLDPKLAPSTRSTMLDEVGQLTERRKELERAASRAETRAAEYQRRLPEGYQHVEPQKRLPQGNDQHQRSVMGSVGRVLGWGAAIAGGWSVASFMSQSRAKYQQSVDGEATLSARGIKGANAGSATGHGPLEYQHLLKNLSHTTGSSGSVAQQQALTSALFSRSQGVDLGEAAKLHQMTYAATGRNDLSNQMLIGLTATGVDKSKMPQLLEQIGKNTAIMAQAQGGAGLSQDQVLMAAYASVQAMREGKPEQAVYAKSGEFTNTMQNGMRHSSGTIAGDIILGRITGAFDGAMSFKKQFQIEQTKEGGFFQHPELLQKILKQVEQYSGSDNEARAGALMRLFPSWGLSTKSSMMMTTAFDRGGILEGFTGDKKEMEKRLHSLIAKGGADGKRAHELQAEINKTAGMDKLQQAALKEVVEIKVGEKVHETFGKMEMGALKFADALTDGNWQKAFAELTKSSGEMGAAGKLMLAAGTMQVGSAALSMLPTGAAGAAGRGAIMSKFLLPALVGTGAYAGTSMLLDYFNGGDYGKTAEKAIPEYSDQTGGGKAGLRYKTEQIARLKGVDPNIAKGLVHAESAFNPNAVSSAGAKGLTQLMPAHMKQGENPFDVDLNLNRGIGFYRQMQDKYKDQRKALAAYNWGPGNLDRAISKYGDQWEKHAPTETRSYISRVLGLAETYRGMPSEETLSRSPLKRKVYGGQVAIEKSLNKRTEKFKSDKKQAPDGPATDHSLEMMQAISRPEALYQVEKPAKPEIELQAPIVRQQTDPELLQTLKQIAANTTPQRPAITANPMPTVRR